MALRLLIDNPPKADAVLEVGWCVEPDSRQELMQEEAKHPFVLLVTVDQNGNEERRLRPLIGDQIEYVRFKHPGKHNIHAAIVWNGIPEKDVYRLHKSLLEHSRPDAYRNKIVDSGTGEFKPEWVRDKGDWYRAGFRYLSPTSQEVEVGPEFFAPPESAWKEAWVRLLIKSKPENECKFKRRLWFWSLPQAILLPPILFFKYLARIAFTLAAFVVGQRDISLSPFTHPFAQEASDVSSFEASDNFFFTDKKGEGRSPYWLGLWPLSWLTLFFGGFLFKVFIHDLDLTFVKTMLYMAIMIVVGYEASLFLLNAAAKIGLVASDEEVWAAKKAKQEREEKRKRAELLANLERISCGLSATSVAELRANKRPSLRLRYLDLKHKLCKQYAA